MSLVHPSIIATLQRRYVFTYFNTFEGPGYDQDAVDFAKDVAKRAGVDGLKYGALVTPTGELVRRFDFGIEEVADCLSGALADKPEYAWFTPAETAVFTAADLAPAHVEKNLAAAQLWSELLQPARARAVCSRLLTGQLTPAERAQVAYARAHFGVLEIEGRDREALSSELQAIKTDDANLRDDIALDLVNLDLVKRPMGAFFTGSQLREGADALADIKVLKDYLVRNPKAPRTGEALFDLGVTLASIGKVDEANETWKLHYTRFPDDRLALASRLHQKDYAFSPMTETPSVISASGSNNEEMLASILKQLEDQGVTLSDEELADLKKQLEM